MLRITDNAFTFTSTALPEEPFVVVRFSGSEALSSLYLFKILLASEQRVDCAMLLQSDVAFSVQGLFAGDTPVTWHGMLTAVEELHTAQGVFFYQAVLQPRLWRLTQTGRNQIFLNNTLRTYLTDILEDGGLCLGRDFEMRLTGDYPAAEYVCQYNETHFSFFSRWLEHYGVCYWFGPDGGRDKLFVADSPLAHGPVPGHSVCVYAPPSGLEAEQAGRVVTSFSRSDSPLPGRVELREYNPMRPNLDLAVSAVVQEGAPGERHLYGEGYTTPEEGERLAKIRAEALLCHAVACEGVTHIPNLRPGYTFTLSGHFLENCNRGYLITATRHEGSQEAKLALAGVPTSCPGAEKDLPNGLFYRNTITAIPDDTAYRPPITTPKPTLYGLLPARIDAAGSGTTPELDDQGRYKVVLPFDVSGRRDGKRSALVRRAQPYAGQGMGLHFPLTKGTEAALEFVHGDPDRPIIAGALANPLTPAPINDEHPTAVRYRTHDVFEFRLDDNKTNRHIQYTAGEAFIRLGAPPAGDALITGPDTPRNEFLGQPNHASSAALTAVLSGEAPEATADENTPSDAEKKAGHLQDIANKGETALWNWGFLTIKAGLKNEFVLGESVSIVLGAKVLLTLGYNLDFAAAFKFTCSLAAVEELYTLQKRAKLKELRTRASKFYTVLSTFKATTQHTLLEASKAEATLQAIDMEDAVMEAGQTETVLEGITNAVNAAATRLGTAADALTGPDIHISTAIETVALKTEKLAGVDTDIAASRTALVTSQRQTIANRTALHNSSTSLVGQQILT